MSTFEAFQQKHAYRPDLAGYVGLEREAFLVDRKDTIVPKAPQVLSFIRNEGVVYRYREVVSEPEPGSWPIFVSGYFPDYEPMRPGEFGYELSACQIESRTGPCQLDELHGALTDTDRRLHNTVYEFATPSWFRKRNLFLKHIEVAPATMPLDVYPDPSGRYKKIVQGISQEALLAACRVAGTHVHIGMPDYETALKVYNHVCKFFPELCELGNGSFGERLAIYRQMAPDYRPMPYASWQHYYDVACEKGFADDPRKCWTFIRISVHGTIEFRMFGATDSIDRIVSWAARCHELCMEAMAS